MTIASKSRHWHEKAATLKPEGRLFIDGDHVTETLRDMDARIFQHETDHLNGIVMLDRANLYHRTQALKKRYK